MTERNRKELERRLNAISLVPVIVKSDGSVHVAAK